ncbi:MAG: MazG nucleotide pyrophosphohydrolase domain-containing protein [Chloroflexota bacterium]
MELKALEEAMQSFVEGKGWYKPDSPHPQTPKNIAISLVLEANEVLEHFQWNEQVADKTELAGELADVLLYLLQIARLHDIDLGQAVMDKLDINAKREW